MAKTDAHPRPARTLSRSARGTLPGLVAGLAMIAGCRTKDDPSVRLNGADGSASLSAGSASGSSSEGSAGSEGAIACSGDDDCDDGNACNGQEQCGADQRCEAGELPDGPTPCGDARMCVDGECVPVSCGNGTLEPGEECDDGNQATFDGCDRACRYEIFYRIYELTLMRSPAASFCDRPNSVLGDSLSSFALEANNAGRKAKIDTGHYSAMFQFVNMVDPSGRTDGTMELRQGMALLDPERGEWPSDGSNPIDWSYLLKDASLAGDGTLGLRIPDVVLSGGEFVGSSGINSLAVAEFLDLAVRGRFDDGEPDRPAPPPTSLADDLVVPRELIADGPDEGFCGDIAVLSLARAPVDVELVDCLECPGVSRTYQPCPGSEVTDDCNSVLDALVGGCVFGLTCEASVPIAMPTQPDVDHGGVAPLVPDPETGKIPLADTDDNLNGFTAYFRFRARRAHATGVVGAD